MLLVDTSVWSNHLRRHDVPLARQLEARRVLVHPFVIGEIACGMFPSRTEALAALNGLPSAPLLGQTELLGFIERHTLAGKGVGFVDIHLLASALVAGAELWTRDRRLAEAAAGLGVVIYTGH
jgi:predicted nucleic acid-binding protein